MNFTDAVAITKDRLQPLMIITGHLWLVIIINGRLQTLMRASVFVRQASFSPDMEEHPDNRPLYRDGTKLMDIRHVHKRLHDNIWRIFLLYKSIKVHLMKKKDRFDSN